MRVTTVMKFGGTSMGSSGTISQVIAVIKQSRRRARVAAVVVSALSGVTDELIAISHLAAANDGSYKSRLDKLKERHLHTVDALVSKRHRKRAHEVITNLGGHLERVVQGISQVRELSPGALDYVMSYGERMSAHILSEALNDRGVPCEYLNARTVITTDDTFGEAVVDFPKTNARIRAHFKAHKKLQVVTGFIASTSARKTTTLGRGGSDYSASILGAALHVSRIEIWTDVPGVYTADPRKVPEAYPINAVTYREAAELSYFGAKVIHPPTMRPAADRKIPLLIKNTFEPESPGTLIDGKAIPRKMLATGISSIGGMSMLQIEGSAMVGPRGVAGRILSTLAREKVNVIVITQGSSQHSMSLAVPSMYAKRAKILIEEEFALERVRGLLEPIVIKSDLAIVAIVGEGMRHVRGVAGRLFGTLASHGVNVVAIAQGSSELNISVVIEEADVAKALNAVHGAFFFPLRKVINVYLVGAGLIGGTLLAQVEKQRESLLRAHNVALRVIAIGDADHMLFDVRGLSLKKWRVALSRSKVHMDLRKFIERMKRSDGTRKVFVDCTASEAVARTYAEILESGISIVTPNKKAASGDFTYYDRLLNISASRGAGYFFETNVGAALPVISTLRDLVRSGDSIISIEAILSGTLSYIFNVFNGEQPFSAVVREAKKNGYTEPDPRADLSGEDVARKITILAREAGSALELKQVHVESFVSSKGMRATSVEDFFNVLEKEDALFENKRAAAEHVGKRLRYIATFEKGKARVALQAVGPSHPFYEMRGSDNVVSFTTKRYRKTPLVVKGPGAGAEVTAGGVFADILRTAL